MNSNGIRQFLCVYMMNAGSVYFHFMNRQGKGFPDLASRQLLSAVSSTFPHLPCWYIGDGDPYGLEIFSVWKFGSQALSRELHSTCPALQWIGVALLDLVEREVPADQFFALTDRDARKLESLLQRTCLSTETDVQSQLQQMKAAQIRADVEALHAIGSDALEHYILEKIQTR